MGVEFFYTIYPSCEDTLFDKKKSEIGSNFDHSLEAYSRSHFCTFQTSFSISSRNLEYIRDFVIQILQYDLKHLVSDQ